MMRFKKLIALTLVFVGALGLVGCKPVEDGPTDLEQLAEALLEVELASETSSNLTLPSTGLHDVVITWSSSNTSVIGNDGTVTVPTFTEGNKVVTITASLTLGDDTLTKTFNVTVLAATTKTDAEKIAEAKASLLLVASDLVVADIVLPVISGDATVVWATSDATLITAAGVVTRPTFGDGNKAVTLTATLTLGALTETKEFALTIKEEAPENLFTSLLTLYSNSLIGDVVEFEGIVTGLFDGGYVLTDGTYAITIYDYKTPLEPDIGDSVYVKGEYASYYTLYQIKFPDVEEIKSTGNTIPLDPVEMSIADLLALNSGIKLIHGMQYTITGFVTEGVNGYGDPALHISLDGNSVMIYGYNLEDPLEDLESFTGQKVTLTVTYYADHSKHGVIVFFDGTENDIVSAVLTDAEALSADIASAGDSVDNATLEDIILPTFGSNGTIFGTWTSDTTAVIASDGTFVARAATTVTVTFTASATKGDETGTVTIEVVVPILSSIEDVLEMDSGDYFEVTGVVYDESTYGFFIYEDGHYLFIYVGYGGALLDVVAPGDEITILGYLGEYSGLLQANVIDYTVGTSGNTLPNEFVLSVGAVENDLVERGTLATITGTLEERTSGDYTNTWIVGPAGSAVQIYHYSNADELDNNIGDIVTITVVTYQDALVLYQGLEADITVETAFTDLQTAQDIADMIDLGDIENVEYDLTLPVTNADPVATMVWLSSNTDVVAIDGVVNRIPGSDTLITLTVTVTVNSVDATRDIIVNVIDANEGVPVNVAAALAATDGDSLLVKGIVSGFVFSWDGQRPFIQDADGTAILVYTLFPDLEIGDEVIVRAERATYPYNDNDLQQLIDATLIQTLTVGNNVIVFDDVSLADIALDPVSHQGKNVTITGMVITAMTYEYEAGKFKDYIVITDGTTDFIFDDEDVPYALDLWTATDILGEITFTVYDVYYGALRLIVTDYPAPVDTYALTTAEAELSLPDSVSSDIELPLISDLYDVTITWATNDAAHITAAGVVTRPANGEGDATVTLTATLSIGTETPVTKDFIIVVNELAPPYTATGTELFITEYAENGNEKALEIFNPTSNPIDLSAYTIKVASNGHDYWNSSVLNLSGYIDQGGTIVIVYDDATGTVLVAAADIVSGVISFNGDDCVGLFKDGTLIDMFGVFAETSWKDADIPTDDIVLYRAATVIGPNNVWDYTEWVVGVEDDHSNLGEHTVTPAS